MPIWVPFSSLYIGFWISSITINGRAGHLNACRERTHMKHLYRSDSTYRNFSVEDGLLSDLYCKYW